MNTAEIRAALAAATPGPWARWTDQDGTPHMRGLIMVGVADEVIPAGEFMVTAREPDGASPVAECYVTDDADLIANAPTYIADLLAEVDRLARWQTEATEVLRGLQDLGKALGLPLGEQITGQSACVAAVALHDRTEAAEQAIQRVREFAEQGREFADRTMDDAAAHWARSAADGIIRALDGGEQHG